MPELHLLFCQQPGAEQGITALAAHQILLQVYLFSSYFTDGVAVSANIIGSQALAGGDTRRLQIAYRRLLHLGLGIGVLFGLVYGLAPNHILGLFSGDAKVLAGALAIWPLLVFTQPSPPSPSLTTA